MKNNFAPWTDTAPPAASAVDAGGTEALLRAVEELSQAAARLAELSQQPAPVAVQITVTDGGGNSLPFTTPDGPDLSLFS